MTTMDPWTSSPPSIVSIPTPTLTDCLPPVVSQSDRGISRSEQEAVPPLRLKIRLGRPDQMMIVPDQTQNHHSQFDSNTDKTADLNHSIGVRRVSSRENSAETRLSEPDEASSSVDSCSESGSLNQAVVDAFMDPDSSPGKIESPSKRKQYVPRKTEHLRNNPFSETLDASLNVEKDFCTEIENSLKCAVCGISSNQDSCSKFYEDHHNNETPFICDICDLKRHLLSHRVQVDSGMETPLIENGDDGAENEDDNYLGHKTDINPGKPLTCELCDKTFREVRNLKQHQIRNHIAEKEHQCPTCHRQFVRMTELTLHIRTHTGEKPHKCDLCGLCFISIGKLNSHKVVHTEQKPYDCDKCGSRFKRSSGLNRHKKDVHTPPPKEAMFMCSACGKSFTKYDNMRKHESIHNGKKPHSCDICQKSFRRLQDMKEHRGRHSQDKSFTCETCGKMFSIASDLRKHKTVHTGKKPHSCARCGKAFRLSTDLRKHEKIHEREDNSDLVMDIDRRGSVSLDVVPPLLIS